MSKVSGKHIHLVCKQCGKEHTRTYNGMQGFGLSNCCEAQLVRASVLSKKQNEKAKKELEELGSDTCP